MQARTATTAVGAGCVLTGGIYTHSYLQFQCVDAAAETTCAVLHLFRWAVSAISAVQDK